MGPQRHASGGGGTVHHNPNNLQVPQLQRPQLQILGSANVGGHRRLSGSGLEIGGPLAGSARIEEKKQKMICISCVFSIYIYLSISIHILLPKCDQKERRRRKKKLLRKKNLLPMIFATISR